jgi:hypothetical protein
VTQYERIEQIIISILAAAGAAIVTACAWLVRRVLTNQRQIELLERDLAHRNEQRKEDRAAIDDVRSSVIRIENVLLDKKG